MKLKCITAAACAALLSACAATGAVGLFKDFQVNGETVTAAYQQGLFDDQIARGQKDTPELRYAVKALATEQAAITQEAKKEGLTEHPAVKRRLEAARVQVLAQALSEARLRAHPVTEQEMKAAYGRLSDDYGPSEYRVRQIFVDDEKDAKTLEVRLSKRPSAFTQYAKTENDNRVLADRAGDMGWIAASIFQEPVLRDALKNAKQGTNTKALRTQAGWHFLRVEAIRPRANFPTYDRVKTQIAAQLAEQKARTYLADIVRRAEVK